MELIFIIGIKEDVKYVYINNPSIYMCTTLFQTHLNTHPQIHTHTLTPSLLTVASVLQKISPRNISKFLSCDLEGDVM